MLIGVDASRVLRARRTGTERYSFEIIRHLLALPDAGAHRWRLYTDVAPAPALMDSLGAAAARGEIEWRVLPARRLWTHRALAAELVRHKPDVLFVPAHVLPFLPWPGALPPSVVTLHDLGYHWFPQAHTWRQQRYLEVSTRWSARAAQRIIAVSQATAHDLTQVYGVPAAKIDVVYEASSAPVAVSAAARDALRQQYRLTRPYALFVGTLQPRKNVVRLAQAYAALVATQEVAFDLVLAGAPGWLSGPVEAELDALHLGERLRRLGYVPDDALPALLAGADQLCLVSLYEGFGLPVLEAQRYGVPVMCANNSSLPEVAGDAALLVDPNDVDAIADAMLRLSQDEPLRQQLIAAGYENLKRFSWEKAARETWEVLRACARGAG